MLCVVRVVKCVDCCMTSVGGRCLLLVVCCVLSIVCVSCVVCCLFVVVR